MPFLTPNEKEGMGGFIVEAPLVGLLLLGVVLGLSTPSTSGSLTAGWYAGLTVVTLVLAYLGRDIGRWAGWGG